MHTLIVKQYIVCSLYVDRSVGPMSSIQHMATSYSQMALHDHMLRIMLFLTNFITVQQSSEGLCVDAVSI